MSEKIVVPESRIKAVADRVFPAIPRGDVRRICQAFAEELSDHPEVPTDEQIKDIFNEYPEGPSVVGPKQVIEWWQRRMFLSPEPEVNPAVRRVKDALMGCTLTAGDAVELMDAVRMCTNPDAQVPEGDRIEPYKCPHRWQRRFDKNTHEYVVDCELCGWVYSHTSEEAYRSVQQAKEKRGQ